MKKAIFLTIVALALNNQIALSAEKATNKGLYKINNICFAIYDQTNKMDEKDTELLIKAMSDSLTEISLIKDKALLNLKNEVRKTDLTDEKIALMEKYFNNIMSCETLLKFFWNSEMPVKDTYQATLKKNGKMFYAESIAPDKIYFNQYSLIKTLIIGQHETDTMILKCEGAHSINNTILHEIFHLTLPAGWLERNEEEAIVRTAANAIFPSNTIVCENVKK